MTENTEKKKKPRGCGARAVIVILSLLLLLTAGGGLFLYFFMRPDRKLPGNWLREVSLGNTARENGRMWLDGADKGNELPLDGLKGAHLTMTLSLENGSWTQSVNAEDYAAQEESALRVLSSSLKKLIVLRAEALGAEGITEDKAEAAIVAVTGMSSMEYLKQYGPELLPALGTLEAEYNGSGSYRTENGMLLRDGCEDMRFMVDERTLVLSDANGKSSIYRRQKESGQEEVTVLSRLFSPLVAHAAGENHNILENLTISVDGGTPVTVKALDFAYDNNRYVSMRDMAAALNGSEKSISLSVTGDRIDIGSGGEYTPTEHDNNPFPKTQRDYDDNNALYRTGVLKVNKLVLDENFEPHYYTMIGDTDGGRKDAYISITDLAMLLDLHIVFDGEAMSVNTKEHFTVDMEELREDGFYYEVHSALVGNATTGQIYEGWEEELSVPIASTTKLMTYLCVMDAITNGEISYDTVARVSKKGEILSRTGDGVIDMQEGKEAPVRELLNAMLLPSSNESALTLAETVAGSEEDFVERMNAKARLLGLSEATIFYNCHGLPTYTENLSTSKIQNRMSAADMFRMVCHILKTYPEIREITSQKTAHLPSFSRDVKNTNPLLHNLPGCFGLKTGTTNMSGACLVSAMDATAPDGSVQQLVAVEFGAEDSLVRATVSHELLLYGKQCLEAGEQPPEEAHMPTDAEELVTEALKNLR